MIKCPSCSKMFEQEKGVGCVCSKYGFLGHDWSVWCSQECMEQSHPDEDEPKLDFEGDIFPSDFNLEEFEEDD